MTAQNTIAERLREQCLKLRTKSTPLADLIPLLQQSADALDHIVRRLEMDIADGSRPDQWSMEDLVRKAHGPLAKPRDD